LDTLLLLQLLLLLLLVLVRFGASAIDAAS
jgi:hypothetical protein